MDDIIQEAFDEHWLNAFNARWLSAEEVARTFVPPIQFKDLTQGGHTLLVGPRGSGKTTLLKMLQQSALEVWAGESADATRKRIDYSSVFIPADISWAEQLNSLGDRKLDSSTHELLSTAAFTTHILRALIDSMRERIGETAKKNTVIRFRRVSLSPESESALVANLSKEWHLAPTIQTLSSVRVALNSRILELGAIAKRESFVGAADRQSRLSGIEFLFIDFLAAVNSCVYMFDELVDERSNKWALLFDELEIVPASIQKNLIKLLRSTSPKLFFKLALSPFSEHASIMESPTSGTPGNDFVQIQLWYEHKEQPRYGDAKLSFCQKLWNAMLLQRGFKALTPEQALGPAFLDVDESLPNLEITLDTRKRSITGGKGAYSAGGKWGRRFISLYRKDPTFREFLDARDINPNQLDLVNKTVRDEVIRKIAPLVSVREFYLRESTVKGESKERSRKGISLYTGAESVFTVSEGHPRWFKLVIGRLLDFAETNKGKMISRVKQGEEVLSAAQRFSSLIRTYPAEFPTNDRELTVLGLIRKVSNFFHDEVVTRPFRLDPYLSFTVDSHIPKGVLTALEIALNQGAIVYIPDKTAQVLLTSLQGKRFRVSFWLAPLYGVPLNVGRSISLSQILATKSDTASGQLFE